MSYEKYGIKISHQLRPKQLESISSIEQGKNTVTVLPTGGGKTISEVIACARAISMGFQAVVCVPMKSLGYEKDTTMQKYFNNIILDDGDHPIPLDRYEEKWNVVVQTYERTQSFLKSEEKRKLFENVKAFVFDEIHMFGDPSRGYRIEAMMIDIQRFFPNAQLVGSSATIDNAIDFSEKLDFFLVLQPKSERPVPLETEVIVHNKEYDASMKLHIKVNCIKQILLKHPNKQILIFVSSVERTYLIAKMLAGYSNARSNVGVIDFAKKEKIAWHHAHIEDEEKRFVESEFLKGNINIIVATPTLSVGVNLPADVVILSDTYMFDYLNGERIIEKARLEQTMGRAGRPQFSKIGYAYLLCDYTQEEEVVEHMNKPFNIESQLKKNINDAYLNWIVSGTVLNVSEAFKLLNHFYDETITETDIINALDYLEHYGFIGTDKGNLFVTYKGKMTAMFFMQPETVVFWENATRKYKDIPLATFFCLIAGAFQYCSTVTMQKYDYPIVQISQQYLGSEGMTILNNEVNSIFTQSVLKIFSYTFKDELIEHFNLNSNFVKLSRSDIKQTKKNAKEYLTAYQVILRINKEKIDKLLLGVEKSTLNENVLIFAIIDGIGEKRLNTLMENNYDAKKFVNGDSTVIGKLLRLKPESIDKMKLEIIKNTK